MPVFKVSFIWIWLFSLFLSGCGLIKNSYREFAPDRDTEYLDAYLIPPLKVPEGTVVAYNQHSPYLLPHGSLPGDDAEPLDLVPPGGQAVWDKAQAELAKEQPLKQDSEQD